MPTYYDQCQSSTTSRLSKRRWYVLRLLSGAISSTWLYLCNLFYLLLVTSMAHISADNRL